MSDASTVNAAMEFLALNIYSIPVLARDKKPALSAWTDLRIEIDDLKEHFRNGNNIGILVGINPRPIADQDRDCTEVLAVAPFLKGPTTQRIFGRKSKPHSHLLFEVAEEFEPRQFKDPVLAKINPRSKNMLIELRGKGGQTIVPPSVHPEGEQLVWEHKGDFGKSTVAELLAWTAKIAAAALLARYWQHGHETRQALAGTLARGGWPEAEASEFVCAVLKVAQPDNTEGRADVRSTYARHKRGEKAFGRTKLSELLGEHGKLIVQTVVQWLGLPDSESQGVGERNAPVGEIASEIVLVRASDVTIVAPEWLYFERIPFRYVTNFVGPPDVGKDSVTVDLLARTSRGKDFPDRKNPHPPIDVLMLVSEEGLADTVVPRLIVAGADLDRVHFATQTKISQDAKTAERRIALDQDLGAIRRTLKANPSIRLVVISPMGSYLGKLKKNSDDHIRPLMDDLRKLAEDTNVAIVCISHFNKNFLQSAIDRTGGAGAIGQSPRAAWASVKDPEDLTGQARLMLAVKANNVKEASKVGLRYRFVEKFLSIEGKQHGFPTVEWLGASGRKIDEVLQQATDREGTKVAACSKWLAVQRKC